MVAGALVLGWQALRRQRFPTGPQWPRAALVGSLLLVVGNGGVAVAEHWLSSGATVALISAIPLATALWSGVFRIWPRRLEWVAISLGACGTAVMLLGRDLQASAVGTCVLLLSIAGWSLGTVVVFGSVIGFSAYRFLVERVSPTLATSYAYVNPPVALFVGWWLGNESLRRLFHQASSCARRRGAQGPRYSSGSRWTYAHQHLVFSPARVPRYCFSRAPRAERAPDRRNPPIRFPFLKRPADAHQLTPADRCGRRSDGQAAWLRPVFFATSSCCRDRCNSSAAASPASGVAAATPTLMLT